MTVGYTVCLGYPEKNSLHPNTEEALTRKSGLKGFGRAHEVHHELQLGVTPFLTVSEVEAGNLNIDVSPFSFRRNFDKHANAPSNAEGVRILP